MKKMGQMKKTELITLLSNVKNQGIDLFTGDVDLKKATKDQLILICYFNGLTAKGV